MVPRPPLGERSRSSAVMHLTPELEGTGSTPASGNTCRVSVTPAVEEREAARDKGAVHCLGEGQYVSRHWGWRSFAGESAEGTLQSQGTFVGKLTKSRETRASDQQQKEQRTGRVQMESGGIGWAQCSAGHQHVRHERGGGVCGIKVE